MMPRLQVESGRRPWRQVLPRRHRGLPRRSPDIYKSEEIKQAQLEITEKMAELNVTETQLKQSLATIQAAKAAAQAQLTQLETAKASYDQIIAALQSPDLTTEQREALEAQKNELQPIIDSYDTSHSTLETTIRNYRSRKQRFSKDLIRWLRERDSWNLSRIR